jgi:hypothetical protein
MILKLATRFEMLKMALKQDRGEGPIPHVIMIAVISVGAFAIATAIIVLANEWVDEIQPAQQPQP